MGLVNNLRVYSGDKRSTGLLKVAREKQFWNNLPGTKKKWAKPKQIGA